MNMSQLLTRLKRKLGLLVLATPIENLDQSITDIIYDTTIPVFSKYAPIKQKITLDLDYLKELKSTAEYKEYLLPDYGRKIIYVEDMYPDSSKYTGLGYHSIAYPSVGMDAIHSLMISNASGNLLSSMMPALTFEFQDPNIIRIFNCHVSTAIVVSIAFEHDKNLTSIPISQEESFFKLALLDVKDGLYPTMKYYNELQTAHGNINLRIDDWQNAEAERNDLLEKWDDVYHLDAKTIYYG